MWHFYIGSIPIVATIKEISLKRLKTLKMKKIILPIVFRSYAKLNNSIDFIEIYESGMQELKSLYDKLVNSYDLKISFSTFQSQLLSLCKSKNSNRFIFQIDNFDIVLVNTDLIPMYHSFETIAEANY